MKIFAYFFNGSILSLYLIWIVSRKELFSEAASPSVWPTSIPSSQLVCTPTVFPSNFPSLSPSQKPSSKPSCQPTSQPTRQPTRQPTSQPSSQPSRQPTSQPSSQPSRQPTRQPTSQPSRQPTNQPSSRPTSQPTSSPSSPTSQPSAQPSTQPSKQPSRQPTSVPTGQPSKQPFAHPTAQPTGFPTKQPSARPTTQPTSNPTNPSGQPTSQPSSRPSSQPSSNPTQPSSQPTSAPSGRPTTQPTANPTNPSSQPTSRPSAQPVANPTQPPTKLESVLYEWMFDPTYGLQLSVIVCVSINGLGVLICIQLLCCMNEDTKGLREVVGTICNLLVNFVNFIFLCGKFDYFLKRKDQFHLYTTADGEYVWPANGYWDSRPAVLREAHCPYSTDVYGELAPLTEKGNENVCNFMVLGFSGELIDNGMIQFSIGLGLILYFGLQLIVLVLRFVIRDWVREQNELPSWIGILLNYCTGYSMKYVIALIVSSQQFCVLMLLTNVQANDYCAYFVTPTSIKTTLCLYLYGVYSLPWSIIFAICTVAGCAVAAALAQAGNWIAIIGALAGIGALFCGIHAIALLGFWLFAGVGVGVWFQFASLEVSLRFIVVESLSVLVYLINDILEVSVACAAHSSGNSSSERSSAYSTVAMTASDRALDDVSERNDRRKRARSVHAAEVSRRDPECAL